MTIKDELSDMLSVDALPQIEPQLDPELEKMKTSLNETILSDPAEATRILLPINKCDNIIAGIEDVSVGTLLSDVIEKLKKCHVYHY